MVDLVGRTLSNRYYVRESLGRGGMAEVYKVWDAERTAILVLKLLREDLAEDLIFLRRFRREADTLAKLDHPNIVRFYGLEQDDLLAFILMDYIDGENLRTEIFRSQGKGMEYDRILEVMRPVCWALQYAHTRGVIHCDIKPGNILIGKGGGVFVSDFGIARMVDAATSTLMGAGTPAYMSPEQIKGKDPTPQMDVYSLGVVLYEMLTGGERPFVGDAAHTTGTTAEKVIWEKTYLEAPSPRRYRADITPEMEAVVLRCLRREPEARFGSVLDLLNAIEIAIMPAGAIQAKPNAEAYQKAGGRTSAEIPSIPTSLNRLRGFVRRLISSRTRAIVSLMVLGVLILGGVFITQRSITIANATATAVAIAEATADAERAVTSTMQAWYTATAKIEQAATQVAQAAKATIQFQRTATAQAKLNASATSKAKKTATAQYMIDILGSVVQPSQEGAEYLTTALQKATLIYGPASGQLDMKEDKQIEYKQANIQEKNFIVVVRFENPYSTSIHSWSYGFPFRDLGGDYGDLRLIISSDGTWELSNGTGGNFITITSGRLNNLDVTSNGSNWIILICEEATGWFYVNDSYVAELDLSARTNSGDVSVATGLYEGDEIEGKYVRYDNFSIWSLK